MFAPALRYLFWLSLVFVGTSVLAESRFVSPSGDDSAAGSESAPWRTIQHGCDQLKPGDVLTVLPGVYEEKIKVRVSGAEGSPITIQGKPGAVISGKGVKGTDLIHLKDQSFVTIEGLELRDNLQVNDGSGIRVEGHGSHLELRNNRIHEIRGKDAMGITVYGTDRDRPVDYIVIDGNHIYDCDPAKSEALVLNGNVSYFQITNNVVHDVNNIGIDMIGGEVSTTGDASKVARHGVCRGNKVYRCRSNYEDGYAAGIYVDGGHDIVVEDNIVTQCDLGIEIAATLVRQPHVQQKKAHDLVAADAAPVKPHHRDAQTFLVDLVKPARHRADRRAAHIGVVDDIGNKAQQTVAIENRHRH